MMTLRGGEKKTKIEKSVKEGVNGFKNCQAFHIVKLPVQAVSTDNEAIGIFSTCLLLFFFRRIEGRKD